MAEVDGAPVLGLRERKKQRTRTTLINVAVDLCDRNGFDNTTVEQIAAAADVSARTFSRYFASKEAVLLTLLDDFTDAVARVLATVPADVPPLQALRDAQVRVLRRVAAQDDPELTPDRITMMLRILNANEALRLAAAEFQFPAVASVLAGRMGVDREDRSVRIAVAVSASVVATACYDLVGDVDGRPLGPHLMADRIEESFRTFAAVTSGTARW
ncbi:TetR family transcriptional regulator [Mycobacterium sp. PS03-16]|uniref:TetR family transcriptional regulator n=1 Tax=Mycobacterium sp. PS03-16 TaxID=2559611 RepID=UPI00107355CC|nr:TetR family transcriptional regulator [Mycobacterium sp. PS03-16]TFV56218.1 TetR family transcriptional regulator [Mycobacterium sp. PS03-16]